MIWGLVFIALGVALLMDHLDYWHFNLGRFLSTWWPLILIIIGLGIIFENPKKTK
jgi:uncharacterized membrane protein YhhN